MLRYIIFEIERWSQISCFRFSTHFSCHHWYCRSYFSCHPWCCSISLVIIDIVEYMFIALLLLVGWHSKCFESFDSFLPSHICRTINFNLKCSFSTNLNQKMLRVCAKYFKINGFTNAHLSSQIRIRWTMQTGTLTAHWKSTRNGRFKERNRFSSVWDQLKLAKSLATLV